MKTFRETDTTAKQAYRYYLRYTIVAPQVIFNEGTITQLLGSGNMQLVADHAIADSITAYTSYVKVDKVQAGYCNDQFREYFDFHQRVCNESCCDKSKGRCIDCIAEKKNIKLKSYLVLFMLPPYGPEPSG